MQASTIGGDKAQQLPTGSVVQNEKTTQKSSQVDDFNISTICTIQKTDSRGLTVGTSTAKIECFSLAGERH